LSVKEILETARSVTGKTIPAEIAPRRSGDPPVLIACSDRARKLLNWVPRYENARAIIESAWKWMEKHPDGYQDR
jgi:UDP-glucose 4-epimerase